MDEEEDTKGPFDAFLSAALAAVLAVFFAWRLFFFKDKRPPSIEAASSSASDDDDDDEKTLSLVDDDMSDNELDPPKPGPSSSPQTLHKNEKTSPSKSPLKSVSTLLETDSILPSGPSSSSSRPVQKPPPVPAFDPDELTAAIESMHTPPEQSPEFKINTFGVQKEFDEQQQKAMLAALFEGGTPPNEWPAEQSEYMVFSGPGLIDFVSASNMDPMGFGYLDAITEEDSDDLRSHSSASSHRFGSVSAQSSIRAPSADVVEQVDNRISQILDNLSEESTPVVSRRESAQELLSEASESLPESETPNIMLPRITQIQKEQELEHEPLKKVKRVSDADRSQSEIMVQNSPLRETTDSLPPPPSMTKVHVNPEDVTSPSVSIDFDHSRDSLLDQSITSNPHDETAILAEFSGSSGQSMDKRHQDSDHDNDQDEDVKHLLTPSAAAGAAAEDKHDESFDSEGLPPPPLPQAPPPDDSQEVVFEEPVPLSKIREFEHVELVNRPVLPDPDRKREDSDRVIDATDEEIRLTNPTHTDPSEEAPKETESVTQPASDRIEGSRKPPVDLSSPERLSSLLYGYNGGLSPLYWQTRRLSPENDKENYTSIRSPLYNFGDPVRSNLARPQVNESTYNSVLGPNYSREERTSFQRESYGTKPLDIDFERSNRRLARYGQTYADAPLSYISAFESKNPTMDHPTTEVPIFPTSQQRTYAESTGYRTDADTSRDDLMSDAGRRSRATVREIPVQRSQSAFSQSRAPTTSGSIMDIKTIGAGGTGWTTVRHEPAPGEEYYRREVMTRTLVTRSTEALSQQPLPITRSPAPDVYRYLPAPRDEITEEYITKYSRSVEEEERRIRETQERRRLEEEERRRREEEIRRRFDREEQERLEKIRFDMARMEKDLEDKMAYRERVERERLEKERMERDALERRRRAEWDRLEDERRALEEAELARRREMERLERERLERERFEAERLEKERLARERLELERIEFERIERERIERERIEIERLEIERIERIKREQIEKERRDRERERLERERLEQERLEAERLEKERIEQERLERELIEQQRREAEQRERERREDELREMRRREQEARDREIMLLAEREAQERERKRRYQEQLEKERLEMLRREQEKLEREKQDADRREKERAEEERRERELLAAKDGAKLRRDRERAEEEQRERERQEQERMERDRREKERREALERERARLIEEQRERDALMDLERIAAERRAQREMEERRARDRELLEREAAQLKEQERLEAEKREKERLEEERRLAEMRDQERRNAAQRDAERREAAEREAARRRDDRRSRERLDIIVKEREDREKWELERKRVLAEKEAANRKKNDLTSHQTLERLTRKPYYSRENLSQPEVTTKVERQVIERVDRTMYSSDGQPITSTSYYTGGGTSINPPLDNMSGDDLGARDRLFQSRNDDLRLSNRTSRYRQRVDRDRARRDFFSADSSQNDALERMRRSNEDLARRLEYRGPLLSKFNSGEFSTSHRLIGSSDVDSGYPRVGPGAYDRHDDEIHRSRSGMDYNASVQQETSTRRGWYSPKAEGNHTRSKSADMLMDQKARDDATAPENELQKQGSDQISEHELRFRKSVEKMHVPDWYKDYATRHQASTATTTTHHRYDLPPSSTAPLRDRYDLPPSSTAVPPRERYDLPPSQPWSYTNPPLSSTVTQSQHRTPTSPPVGGISFPSGMFDKYKTEIEDVRRSRTSLHQIGQATTPQEHTKEFHARENTADFLSSIPPETATITREFSQETLLKRTETVSTAGKHLPGYTVSAIPSDWDIGRDSNSRVIEVADTFIGKHQEVNKSVRYGGRVTVEEVLDSIFQRTKQSDVPQDPSLPQSERGPNENIEGPGIYTSNYMLMDKVIDQPHLAEDLLSKENLYVRCGRCSKTRTIREAKSYYVSCKHCYTYYCSRQCRQQDWERHRERCSFARINTLCKEVIMKVRQDAETQYHMSRVARDGFKNFGRGSVNIRLMSAHAAQQYLSRGWKAFENLDHTKLLFYYPVDALIEQGKEQSLITLCRKYNPNDKFILSVSIIADIEFCPETPPPEPYSQQQRYEYSPSVQSTTISQRPSHHPHHHQQQQLQSDLYSALVPTDV